MWGGCPIHLHSRIQGEVAALSSPGAECIAYAGVGAEGRYVQQLIGERAEADEDDRCAGTVTAATTKYIPFHYNTYWF